MRFSLQPPGRQTRTRADKILAELRCAVPKLDKRSERHNSWMLAEAWRLVGKRVSVRQEQGREQRRIIRLGRAIWAAPKEDRGQRAAMVGEDVEKLLSGDHPLS